MGSSSLVGTLIAGRYQLVDRLGRGITGDVYLAKHPVLGERFAVKVLGEGYSEDERAIRRLKREAEVVGRLDHPNIVSTVDFGEMDNGRFYLVMEYVHGHSLRKELRKTYPNLLPLKRALMLLKQLCHGLTAAHDTGVIHRAVKPANVLLTRSPSGDDQVKLVDFGMAKMIADDGGADVTRDRQILGTPAYMAPEQLTGAPVDRRADIYSVGVVAFQMLTGDLPFAGKKPIQVVAAQQEQAAPQLSLLRPADETKVPRALEKIFMECVAVDREERPRHVSLVTEAILMALPQVPDEEQRKSTITRVAGSRDEAARWSAGDSGGEHTAEIEFKDIEQFYEEHGEKKRELSQLTEEQKRNQLWNIVNKKAFKLAKLLQEYQLAPDELSEYLVTISTLEEQEVEAETKITVLKEELNETDTQWREKTASLRDALLNLRVAHSRLMEDQTGNQSIIDALDQQIQELETRLGGLTKETEAQQKKLESRIESRRSELETIQNLLGETQLIVLQLLRQCKKPEQPPDVEESYAVLENLLRHV